MTALSADARAEISPGTLFRELDGEAVLLNLESGHYYGLDEVGTRILSLLVDG
ncbi:MAG: PqqD family peptide modification chaperone, partial [Anaerolineae bacterium]|nr:PqqD family peptide modification chaperone [Anaerolineae bacterium]